MMLAREDSDRTAALYLTRQVDDDGGRWPIVDVKGRCSLAACGGRKGAVESEGEVSPVSADGRSAKDGQR